MAFKEGKTWFADWHDAAGRRVRKAFTKQGDALLHERTERALRDLDNATQQLMQLATPRERKKVRAVIKAASELRTA